MGLQRVGHDSATEHSCLTQMCSFKVTPHKDSIKSLARVLFHLFREGKAKGHFIPSLILISLLNNDDEFTPWQQWTEGWLETGVNLGVWGTAGASHTWLSILVARLRLSAARRAWLAVDLMPERASSLRTWHRQRAQPTSSKSKRKQWQWRSPSSVWLFVTLWIIVRQAPKHALKKPHSIYWIERRKFSGGPPDPWESCLSSESLSALVGVCCSYCSHHCITYHWFTSYALQVGVRVRDTYSQWERQNARTKWGRNTFFHFHTSQ